MVNSCSQLNTEISREIRLGWMAFTTIKDVLNVKLDKILKANLFNNTILPTILYASKTWATMKKEEKQLVTTEEPGKINAASLDQSGSGRNGNEGTPLNQKLQDWSLTTK